MTWAYKEIVERMLEKLINFDEFEGIYLGGSSVDQNHDVLSDVDVGLTSANNKNAEEELWEICLNIVQDLKPAHHLVRRWGNCRMVAVLIQSEVFPPLGLEIDIIVSQLQFVKEQMPFSQYKILYDRQGRLEKAMQTLPRKIGTCDQEELVVEVCRSTPFYFHDAMKALYRGDIATVYEKVYCLCALLCRVAKLAKGVPAFDGKRGFSYLNKEEKLLIKRIFCFADGKGIQKLVEYLINRITEIGGKGTTAELRRIMEVMKPVNH